MQAALFTGVIVVNPDEIRAKEGYVNSVSAAIEEQFFSPSQAARHCQHKPVMASSSVYVIRVRFPPGVHSKSSFSFAGPACDGDQGGLVDGHGRGTRFQQGRSDDDRVLCFTSGGAVREIRRPSCKLSEQARSKQSWSVRRALQQAIGQSRNSASAGGSCWRARSCSPPQVSLDTGSPD